MAKVASRFTLRMYIALQIAMFTAAILLGSAELRTDDSGWCVHFREWFSVCHNAATDYVLAAPGPAEVVMR